MSEKVIFRQLFDYDTWTYTYLLACAKTREAVIIDPVLEKVDRDLSLLRELNLKLVYILETHIHADHITGAAKLRAATGAKIGVNQVAQVKQADLQIVDGQVLPLGDLQIKAIATPGHTNTCTSYFVEGRVFTGDTLFVRDVGRTDFQQGSNQKMYESITQKLFTLPKETLVYPAHDYRGMEMSTVAEEISFNVKVGGGKTLEEFSQLMLNMKLGQPKKIHIAVPANLTCGIELPSGT